MPAVTPINTSSTIPALPFELLCAFVDWSLNSVKGKEAVFDKCLFGPRDFCQLGTFVSERLKSGILSGNQ